MWTPKRTVHVCLASEKVTLPLAVAIGKSKGIRFEVFQNNCTLHVNQTCLPIYGPICNPLLLIQGLEWHPNSKIPNICSWLETPPTCTSIRVPVVRSRALVTSALQDLICLSSDFLLVPFYYFLSVLAPFTTNHMNMQMWLNCFSRSRIFWCWGRSISICRSIIS